MRSSGRIRRFRALSAAVAASACVLLFHSASFAQQAEPAAKDTAAEQPKAAPAPSPGPSDATAKPAPAQPLPPEYGPPPGYGNQPMPPQPPSYPPGYDPYYGGAPYPPPPPPHYYRPYRRYYQPAPPPVYYGEPITYRPFFFGFGLGVGGVGILFNDPSKSDTSSVGLGYNLRFGFGISPRWSIVLAADGAQAYFNGAGVSETAWTIGPQVFLTRQLYARVGIGGATYSEDACDNYNCYSDAYTDSGMATTAAIGVEFLQHYHTALALEAVGTMGYFPNKDKVSTFGVNFILTLF